MSKYFDESVDDSLVHKVGLPSNLEVLSDDPYSAYESDARAVASPNERTRLGRQSI